MNEIRAGNLDGHRMFAEMILPEGILDLILEEGQPPLQVDVVEAQMVLNHTVEKVADEKKKKPELVTIDECVPDMSVWFRGRHQIDLSPARVWVFTARLSEVFNEFKKKAGVLPMSPSGIT